MHASTPIEVYSLGGATFDPGRNKSGVATDTTFAGAVEAICAQKRSIKSAEVRPHHNGW